MGDTFEDMTGRGETHYMISRSISHLTGLVMTPLAGAEGTASVFIRVHAPVELEIISWVAISERGPPTIPSPFHPDLTTGLSANMILISTEIGGKVPLLIGGGTPGHKWTVSGTYTYGLAEAGDIVRNYPLGRTTNDDPKFNGKNKNYIPGVTFSTDILGDPAEIPEYIPANQQPGLFP